MDIKEVKEDLEKKSKDASIRKQFKNQMAASILGAIGFVAGLAWNDAIKGIIDSIFPFSKDGAIAKIIYAIFITLIVIFVANHFSKNNKEGE